MWRYLPAHSRFRTLQPEGRILDIEPSGPLDDPQAHWALWFRREAEPYHSLLVGRYPTLEAAKAAAQALIHRITHSQET